MLPPAKRMIAQLVFAGYTGRRHSERKDRPIHSNLQVRRPR